MLVLPNCKQVAEQASENIDSPISGIKWLKLKFHLLICKHCSRYFDQIELTSKTIQSIGVEETANTEVRGNVERCYRELHVEKSNKSKQLD